MLLTQKQICLAGILKQLAMRAKIIKDLLNRIHVEARLFLADFDLSYLRSHWYQAFQYFLGYSTV